MKRRIALGCILAVVIAAYFAFSFRKYADYLGKTAHETDRWAVISDSKGDIIAVETTNDTVWTQLAQLHQNQTQMWIGGIVEEYSSKWGFRFNPDTIIVAQITIEGAQSNISGISGDLHYWINVWARETYVLAEVGEIHE